MVGRPGSWASRGNSPQPWGHWGRRARVCLRRHSRRGLYLAAAVYVTSDLLRAGQAHARMQNPRKENGNGPRMRDGSRRVTMDQALEEMRLRAEWLFTKLDRDRSGYLDVVELQQFDQTQSSPSVGSSSKLLALARSSGIPVEFLATVVEQGDIDGDGYISREEFVTWMQGCEKSLKESYDSMDIDGSGLLSMAEVEMAMKRLELPCGGGVVKRVLPQAVVKLVDEMGVSDTHEVDYAEFRYGIVTLARKDLSVVNSYWSKCYVAGPYGDSSLDCDATRMNATGHVFAGFVAGITAKTLTAPLEVVVRLILTGRTPPGSSIGRILTVLWREEGIRGLLKGNVANVLKTPPTRALELTFLSVFRDIMSAPDDITPGPTALSPLAGALAGGCAMILVYPLDTISVRLSVTKGVYSSIGEAMRRTIALERPQALFSGVIPTLLWAFPYMAIQFGILNRLERRYRDQQREALRRGREPPMVDEHLRLVTHGTLASTLAAVACMPLETVRRRMQVQTIGGRQRTFGSFLGVFQHLAAKDGISSLYVGVGVLALKTVLYSALSFAAYEMVKSQLQPILDSD